MIGYYPINPGAPSQEDAFGPRFFKTRFYSWIREACSIDNKTPVLEIMLTSGQVLDVSHLVDLRDDYMLVSVFSDIRDCSQTFHTYIRYQTIYRINVLTQPPEDRPLGFNVRREPLVIADAKPPSGAGESMARRKGAEKSKAALTAKPAKKQSPLRKRRA